MIPSCWSRNHLISRTGGGKIWKCWAVYGNVPLNQFILHKPITSQSLMMCGKQPFRHRSPVSPSKDEESRTVEPSMEWIAMEGQQHGCECQRQSKISKRGMFRVILLSDFANEPFKSWEEPPRSLSHSHWKKYSTLVHYPGAISRDKVKDLHK